VWRKGAQMQGVFVIKEGTNGKEASASCKGKSAGDREKVKKSRER